jgi:Flp pilus assembly protein protease CpaA
MTEIVLRVAVAALASIAGVQDWRAREVSNWITLPLFFAGLSLTFARYNGEGLWLVWSIVLSMTFAVLRGWMGGADWKMQTGLFGLWPLAGFAAFVLVGVVGTGVLIVTRRRGFRFPAVSVMAVAVILSLVVEAFI